MWSSWAQLVSSVDFLSFLTGQSNFCFVVLAIVEQSVGYGSIESYSSPLQSSCCNVKSILVYNLSPGPMVSLLTVFPNLFHLLVLYKS